MKQTHSRSLILPARVALAGTCALLLGATAALAQSTGASSSPAGTSTNTDRYGSGSSSTSSRSDRYDRDRSSGPQTNASTSGAATGSQADTTRSTGGTGRSYSSSSDQSSDTSGTASTGRSRDKLPWGDRRFVTKAADHGMSELQLAQLAAEKASNPEVRNYAQKIVQDHEKVHSELSSLASQKNVKLDKDDDGKDRTYRRLSGKSGSEFDEEFVEHMIEMHEDDVKMFEKAANDAKDSELRSFASKHVDGLREHLQQAQSLRQSIVPTGRDDTRSSTDRSDRRSSSDTNRATDTSTFGTGTTGTGSNPTNSSTSSGSMTSPRSGSSSSDTSTSGNPSGSRR